MTTTRKKKRRTIHDELRDAGACPEARRWARGKTPATIWLTCKRSDWMLWWSGRCDTSAPWSDERKPLVAAGMDCAALALPAYEARYPADDRVRVCVETYQRWARGESVSRENLFQLHAAAYAAAYAATDAAAYAAANAAYAAYAAANAAANVAANAANAAYAAQANAANAAATLAQCADIVRRHYPKMPRMTKPNLD